MLKLKKMSENLKKAVPQGIFSVFTFMSIFWLAIEILVSQGNLRAKLKVYVI